MNTIAFIHNNAPPPLPDAINADDMALEIYPCPWRGNITLRRLKKKHIRIAAAENIPFGKNALPFLPACGNMLRLALLPALLDNCMPKWRRHTIIIDCGKRSGEAAAMMLARETDALRLIGENRNSVAQMLFRTFGCVPKESGNAIALKKIKLPSMLMMKNILLPISLGEAALFSLQIPEMDTAGILELEQLAKKYQMRPCSISFR